jgi:ubiquinone/menaquinone biosynthesis C-methylase UbiE
LPEDIACLAERANAGFDTGPEYRLQKVYGDELWLKLKSLNLGKFDWSDKEVLDIASGSGFLSFHILSRARPKSLTLLDISAAEIEEAKKLLRNPSDFRIKYEVGDATKTKFKDNSFDVIIGNSFLHHFYNLPRALSEFKRILKPGGLFITLHEPTIAAVAVESRNPKNMLLYILKGKDYLDYFRYKGNEAVAPGAGADIWIFREQELIELLKQGGFENVKISHWHFLRPKTAALFGLHLSGKKKKLNTFETILLKSAICSDSILNKILPPSFFGSAALSAQNSH